MKSINKKENKKIAVMAAIIVGLMMFAFMPLAAATVTSFTVTPSSGVVGVVDSYDALVTTDGVTSIDITIPEGFIAVAPATGGVQIARVDFWNSSSKAYYGYATVTSNNADPTEKVDISGEMQVGGDMVVYGPITQDVDYNPGGLTQLEVKMGNGAAWVNITLPTEFQKGSIKITIDCLSLDLLDDVGIAIGQFVRNPKVPGNYLFKADGKDEWVTISGERGCSAVFRNGLWYVDVSGDHNTDIFFQYGIPGDKPAVGDVNNDGCNDVVAYRNTGWWYVDTNGDQVTDESFKYGNPGDIPVVGDVTGDGIDDVVIFRNGQWWVRGVGKVFTYGVAGDIPLVADYDNDGKDEVIIYRNGQWWVRDEGLVVFTYGVAGDKPIVDDIRDDECNDVAVLRNGLWYVKEKAGATTDFTFRYGITGDVPVIHELG
jgi:hypothetical protein